MKPINYLTEMYQDAYFPNFLVDKVKLNLAKIEELLSSGEKNIAAIQLAFDEAVTAINELEEEFDENDSELETVARESIGETVAEILNRYNIELDVEDALRERDW